MFISAKESSERIVFELRRNFKLLSEQLESVPLRSAVAVLTTGTDYKVKIPRKLKELKILACATWYMSDLFRSVFQLEILQKVERNPEYMSVELLLTSEPEMILYILESSVLGKTPNEVFGNIKAAKLEIKISRRFPRKPKQKVRHRGYRDKGTLGNYDSRVRKNEELRDFSLTELQNELELRSEQNVVAIEFTRGFLC